VLSVIGLFEFAKHWLLYASLEAPLGIKWNMGNYLSRGELLRAQGSAGHSIVLGYFIAVAFGVYLFVKKSITSKVFRVLGLILLIGGLIAPLSRGPWVGAAAMLLIFMAIGPAALSKFMKLGLAGLLVVPILISTEEGRAILNYLPFIGTVDESTVDYRERLLEISLEVMFQNPFFGAFDYIYSPAMQDLRQGQGIIDMVNTYLAVGLASGMVGLTLFSGFFITAALSIFKAMRRLPDRNDEHYLLGQSLLATLLGIMVIIFTVSSINIIPIIYWSFGGLGVAYASMLATSRTTVPESNPTDHLNPTPLRSGKGHHALGQLRRGGNR
jgi:O-antigen ligase